MFLFDFLKNKLKVSKNAIREKVLEYIYNVAPELADFDIDYFVYDSKSDTAAISFCLDVSSFESGYIIFKIMNNIYNKIKEENEYIKYSFPLFRKLDAFKKPINEDILTLKELREDALSDKLKSFKYLNTNLTIRSVSSLISNTDRLEKKASTFFENYFKNLSPAEQFEEVKFNAFNKELLLRLTNYAKDDIIRYTIASLTEDRELIKELIDFSKYESIKNKTKKLL